MFLRLSEFYNRRNYEMSPQVVQVCNDAMKLSPYERIELIENLFFSLDASDERRRIDQLWAEEAEDRLSAYEAGEIETISAAEVFEKIKQARQ